MVAKIKTTKIVTVVLEVAVVTVMRTAMDFAGADVEVGTVDSKALREGKALLMMNW